MHPSLLIMQSQQQLLCYLINCNIVSWLLKARSVVIFVPHNNPNLVQNDSTNQLIGALDLHHNGGDVVRGLWGEKIYIY